MRKKRCHLLLFRGRANNFVLEGLANFRKKVGFCQGGPAKLAISSVVLWGGHYVCPEGGCETFGKMSGFVRVSRRM
jgi:hypothetical protein